VPTAIDRPAGGRAGGGLSAVFWRKPWLKLTSTLGAPMAWFVLLYLASLATLLITAFFTVNQFTGDMVRSWTLANFDEIVTNPAYRAIALRTIGMAAAVTVTDAVLAFPLAYFMARVATSITRRILFVAVLIPLWASYLARVYAWILIFTHEGVLNWSLGKLGLPTLDLAYTNTALWIVLSYIWLPFMIVPVYAALERVPGSFIEASADLGGHGWRTTRSIVLPLVLPGVVAGSIFTFSLTLGDFIAPLLVGGTGSKFIASVVYESQGVANNIPFAAAFAMVPLLIMAVYLLAARRLGAFEAM
jgi:putative spermidine/putrescine transport system permease protein